MCFNALGDDPREEYAENSGVLGRSRTEKSHVGAGEALRPPCGLRIDPDRREEGNGIDEELDVGEDDVDDISWWL